MHYHENNTRYMCLVWQKKNPVSLVGICVLYRRNPLHRPCRIPNFLDRFGNLARSTKFLPSSPAHIGATRMKNAKNRALWCSKIMRRFGDASGLEVPEAGIGLILSVKRFAIL
jgi:hypothetical protein